MGRTPLARIALLFALFAQSCAPVIVVPPGAPASSLVLSSTGPEVRFEQLTFDGRSLSAPMFSFDIPAGRHSLGVRYHITISDWCHDGNQVCNGTSVLGTCTGEFTAEPNESYRVLLDTRSGSVKGTIQKRSGAPVYLGQEEDILVPLSCEQSSRKEQPAPDGLITF